MDSYWKTKPGKPSLGRRGRPRVASMDESKCKSYDTQCVMADMLPTLAILDPHDLYIILVLTIEWERYKKLMLPPRISTGCACRSRTAKALETASLH